MPQSAEAGVGVDLILISTSLVSEAVAKVLMKRLIAERVAACVTLSAPLQSTYRWKDQVEIASERVVTIKTRAYLFDRVAAIIRECHDYELPEIMAVPVIFCEESYRKWIEENTVPAHEISD